MRNPSLMAVLGLTVCLTLAGPVAADNVSSNTKHLDLTYLTPDFFGAVVVHPQQIARSPLVAPKVKELMATRPVKELEREMGLDLLKLEQVVILIPVPDKTMRPADQDAPTFILRFGASTDVGKIAQAIQGQIQAYRKFKVVETQVAGKKCFKFEPPPEKQVAPPKDKPPVKKTEPNEKKTAKEKRVVKQPIVSPAMTCVADARTVLVCHRGEADLKKMLAGGEVKSPLVDKLRRLDISGEVVLAFNLDPVRPTIKENLERVRQRTQNRTDPDPEAPLFEIFAVAQSITASGSLTGDTLARLVIQVEDQKQVARVEEQVRAVQEKCREGIDEMRKSMAEMPAQFREQMEQAALLAEQVLNGMTISRTSGRVVVTLKRVKGMEDTLFKLFRVIGDLG